MNPLFLQANPNVPVFVQKLSTEFPVLSEPCTSSWAKESMCNVLVMDDSRAIKGNARKSKTLKWDKVSWKTQSLEEVLTSVDEGRLVSVEDIIYILLRCRNEEGLEYTTRLHACVRRNGWESHTIVGNYLVPMLVDAGSLSEAQQVFDQLMDPNEGCWNALIVGYAKSGNLQKALLLYQKMHGDLSLYPNGSTFLSLLKACAKLKDLESAQKLHNEMIINGLLEIDGNLIGNSLVDAYAKCGSFAKALDVFDKLPFRNVVSWTTLIAGYVEHGHGEKALRCFEQMKKEGILPNAVTFLCSLKACGLSKAAEKGQELHEEIAKAGLEGDLVVGSTLVDMYAKCGLLSKSEDVFNQLQARNVVSWNALIGGYAEHGPGEKALVCFKQMQHEGLSPDAATFVCSLKACVSIRATGRGRELHAAAARTGFEGDLCVGSTLVDLYAKCGSLSEAQEVFDKLSARNVVSWTALIAGYSEHGHGKEALLRFEQMQQEGISPNIVTYVCSLKACSSIGAIGKGQYLHSKVISKGLESHLVVGSTLVDMYAKCGMLAKAQEVFDQLPMRNVVSWTALIGGYVDAGLGEEALNQLELMKKEGVSPNAATFICSLKACGDLGFTDRGQQLHAEVTRKGLETDPVVGSMLVDMYAKCGKMKKAQEVFDKLSGPSVISWNVLIAGYAQVGNNENLFNIFDRMLGKGVKPNLVTFVSVLHACSHAGLVEKGQSLFEVMSKDFGIVPSFEHQSCMIDLLGRAGQLDKAVGMIRKMQVYPDLLGVWRIILGACQKWGNVELGRQAFQHALGLNENDATAYVCWSNMCADLDFQEPHSSVEGNLAWKAASNFPSTKLCGSWKSFSRIESAEPYPKTCFVATL